MANKIRQSYINDNYPPFADDTWSIILIRDSCVLIVNSYRREHAFVDIATICLYEKSALC